MMRFRSFPIGLARQWARLSVRRPDRRTSLVLMVGLVGPLAPVPVAVAAAALLPGGIAARIDLLGICILAGTTAALCAVLVMYHLLAGATVPVGARSEIDRMISGLRDDPGGAARPLREPRPGQHKARRKAQTDPLTGLCNRLGFGAAVPVRGAGTLLYARIDGFSQMVDTHGATAMNRVLRHAAQVLERSLRPEDILARLSGETFAAWLPGTPEDQAWQVSAHLRDAVRHRVLVRGSGVCLSVGLAISDGIADRDTLLTRAGAALDLARAGNHGVVQALDGDASFLFEQETLRRTG